MKKSQVCMLAAAAYIAPHANSGAAFALAGAFTILQFIFLWRERN